MLVLSRYKGEQIIIGEDIIITVVKILGGRAGRVRIGITAPEHVRVDRSEVRIAIERDARRLDEEERKPNR